MKVELGISNMSVVVSMSGCGNYGNLKCGIMDRAGIN